MVGNLRVSYFANYAIGIHKVEQFTMSHCDNVTISFVYDIYWKMIMMIDISIVWLPMVHKAVWWLGWPARRSESIVPLRMKTLIYAIYSGVCQCFLSTNFQKTMAGKKRKLTHTSLCSRITPHMVQTLVNHYTWLFRAITCLQMTNEWFFKTFVLGDIPIATNAWMVATVPWDK